MSKPKLPQKVAVFDFDGTMADTASIFKAIYADMAQRHGWRYPTDEDFENLRKGTIRDARKWAGIPVWRLPIVIRGVKKSMREDAGEVVLFPEVVELINSLNKEGFAIYILSRNLPETIEEVVGRYGLNKEQITVLRRKKRHLGSKALTLMILLRKKRYERKYVWMIGDEIRDIVAAKRAGVNSIAVAWGLQDESILKRYRPTHLVKNVAELRRILQK